MLTMLAEAEIHIGNGTIYIGLATVAALIVATAKAVSLLSDIKAEVASTTTGIAKLEEAFKGSYSRTDATDDFQKLSLANPHLRVPRPDKPGAWFTTSDHKAVTDT